MVLLVYSKLTQRKLKVKEKLEAQYNRLVQTKEQRLAAECNKPIYQSPCAADQVGRKFILNLGNCNVISGWDT